MKDVSEMTVYTIQTNNTICANTLGKTFRMALYPMYDLPDNTRYHKKKYNFRVVFMNERGAFSKEWCYSCLGKDVVNDYISTFIAGKSIGDDWDALQWLVDGEE